MSTHIPSAAITATMRSTLVVNIKDIKGRQLPDVGWRKRSGKFYVKLMVDGQLKHKTVIATGNSASWKESFYIETLDSSVLECQVFVQRKVRSDDFMGGTKDAIELLLAEGATEAVTRTLCKSDARGNLRKTQTTIEFSIIATAKDAFEPTEPSAPPLEHVRVADEVGNTLIDSTKAIADTWDPLIAKIKLFTEMADKVSEVHPYAKVAWGLLSATYKIVIAQKDRDDCVVRLIEAMNDVYSFVEEAEPIKKIESHSQIMILMTQQATECAYFIRDYTINKSFWKRTLKNSFVSEVDNKIKDYENKFNELKMAFRGRAILQTEITVSRILDKFAGFTVDFTLNDMPYAEGARFHSEKGCLPGTREEIIGEIIQWINNPNEDAGSHIFFLAGMAGSGKSTIAHTVARRFKELSRLGSSYCFDRADLANRHPRNLLSTITLDIAELDGQWKMALCNVVKGNRSLRTTLAVTEQFKNFILEPAKALSTIGPILIVIDALDESGDISSRKTLLDILAKRIPDLPSNFRILVTARPEQDIVDALEGCQHVFCKHMDSIDEASNEADIALYIDAQLSGIPSLELEWPNKQWCELLVKSSDGLFQWASTACRAVKEGGGGLRPTERLSRFVSSPNGLDGLYSEVLSQAFDAHDSTAMSRFKLVLGRILATKEPLSISTHSKLRGKNEPADLVELIVQLLGSLLSGVNQLDVPVEALHTSFFDFLTDKSRSKSYYVDPSQHSQILTLSSLQVMKCGLQFNICSLETSHLRNADVADLATRVEGAIPSHLSYGCRFWADHLSTTAYDTTVLGAVSDFLHSHFLYWLEVLSLTKNIDAATRMLTSVLEWNQHKNDHFASFAKDAIKFVAVFMPPISQSAPHIYLSALPFAPKNSLVAQHYLPQFPKTLQLEIGKLDNWQAIGILEAHSEGVSSVAFSHDSKHIVSGSGDNTVRVWDVETGNVIVGPMEQHTRHITSVAISQDGKHIVSGAADNTICVWDAQTGDKIVGPPDRHTGIVNSVAISYDGKHIVSGSADMTICVWDMATGDLVVGPLEGHTSSVNSVAISYDGKCIVSGSADMTIRVWNAETGDMIVGPLEGHTSYINSVAISQDGKYIVSGSADRTILVWNTKTGDIVAGPLEGHTSFINSVAISHDGKRVVSGSADQTIRVWDIETGDIAVLEGHTLFVNSVIISHDGRHIVSGSADKTIRVWDAETGTNVVGPQAEITSYFNSVAISSDGKYIVSGSSDKTIRVWNAETGDMIVGPLEGHTSYVNSVAISQDGKYIVSGSADNTILVWNTETGHIVAGPLEGHTSYVNAVAISYDGKHIASGAADQTIRVWDTETGDMVGGPLEGHTSDVNSVAISHNGKHIVSGSADKTVRMWDAETGDLILGPLEGHSDSINSVAISHDGKHIVSGSSDRTIQMWDAKTGDTIGGPLEGHTSLMKSVAISHDGKHIVSGSRDTTVRVWDVETGDLVIGPLVGHSDAINSVAISHDGKRVVSSSGDRVIRVWDAEIKGPLKGHSDSFTSTGFLHDGQDLASHLSEVADPGISIAHEPGDEFTDKSMLTDGWVLNSPSTLLFWVPTWSRTGLCWPRTSAIIGKVPTRLDLHNFVHGHSWQKCKA